MPTAVKLEEDDEEKGVGEEKEKRFTTYNQSCGTVVTAVQYVSK